MKLVTVPLAQASSLDTLRESFYQTPESTETGIVCGDCTHDYRIAGGTEQVRHASVRHVEFCWTRRAEWAAEATAELAAEYAVERYLEDRGYEEHRAQEAYEAHMGIYY